MNLHRLYIRFCRQYGPQHWWPAKACRYEARCLEICVGAILTQNTNWKNVERALENLRQVKALSLQKLLTLRQAKLARLIRPSGFFNQKAIKLKAFASFVKAQYGGSFRRMFAEQTTTLREKLLAVHGVGKETADSILLYAGSKPVFVIDAYTKRMLAEHGIVFRQYDEYRQFFEQRLPRRVRLYQEFHALIVAFGKIRKAR
jgi:endonuclease-3 related protein